jgi:hypothetical protein
MDQLAQLGPVTVSEVVRALPNDGTVSCVLHQYHSPEVASFDEHHAVPRYYGGPDVPSNIVVLCPTGHRNVHTLLRLFELIGPDAVDRNTWGRTTWDLATRAWVGRRKK